MNITRPRFIPIILCLFITGLIAAMLPYPGFQTPIEPLPPPDFQRGDASTAPHNHGPIPDTVSEPKL